MDDKWIDELESAAEKMGMVGRINRYELRKLGTLARLLAPDGRTRIEMDDSEYDRMRSALGQEWEWQGLVSMVMGRTPVAPTRTSRDSESDEEIAI